MGREWIFQLKKLFFEILEVVCNETKKTCMTQNILRLMVVGKRVCSKEYRNSQNNRINRPSRKVFCPWHWTSSRCSEGLQTRKHNMKLPSTFSHHAADCASRPA